jgi:hypothetical protein
MINIIIFSKDRSCQLELFLRSMKKHFKEWNEQNINILYTTTNDEFNLGYNITKKLHPEFNYIKEKSFKDDLLKLINIKKDFSTFFVDDNVFKEDFSLFDNEMNIFKNDKSILCLSLRLHPNLTYCYPARVNMVKPQLDKNNKFNWRGKSGDFGYPMSLDGHIFRTNDIIDLLKILNYNNPNSLEFRLSCNSINKSFMIMYNKSKILNNPVNKVQNFNNNIHGNISAEFINKKYINGEKISLINFTGIENESCHKEINLIFNFNI